MSDFEVASIRVPAGTIAKGYLGQVTLASGSCIGVPVVIANGIQDGPTLVITAGVHGTEVAGVGALLEVVRTIEPSQLKGRLVAITVANPLAFQSGTYATLDDGMALSGPYFWPPVSEGNLTQRLAAIVGQAIPHATHYIDIHANADPSIPLVMVNSVECLDELTRRGMAEMAEAWGTTIVEMGSHPAVFPVVSATSHGIPAIMTELTGNMFLRQDNVAVGRIGVMNVMKSLGMIAGDLDPQPTPRINGDFAFCGELMANASGLLWIREFPGNFIPRDTIVAEIIDVWGDTVDEIRMPVDGYCWALKGRRGSTHTVVEGSRIGYLFRAAV